MRTPDIEEILDLGGTLHYMDYDKYCFPESSYDNLKKLMLSIPDLKGVHVHDLSLMTYPLHLADQLGFPIKVIQSHAAWGCDAFKSPKSDPDYHKRLDMIRGDQFDRLACSELAGDFTFEDLPYEIIPNAVDLDRFSYNPLYRTILRKQLHISDSTCVIAYVANLLKSKNHLFALEVFREFHKLVPDSVYLILGWGDILREMQKYIDDNDLNDCVRFMGPQTEIDFFYSAIDIVIMPSLSEGLPNSLVEAQAEGLPCLVSDSISDMVKITPLVNSFSLSCDAEAWAKELLRIKNAAAERRTWKNEIKAAGYDIKDVAGTINALYLKRLQSKNPG